MIKQYAVNIKNIINFEQWEIFLKDISKEREKIITRYVFEKDKIRSLLAELLLRYVLEKNYNIEQTEMDFEYEDYGKPYLKNYKGKIFFNLSHSGDWVICGIGNSNIGIDIEDSKREYKPSFVKYTLSDDEYTMWENQPEDDKNKVFYQLWTLKESFAKCIGKGLNIPFETLSFSKNGNEVILKINNELEDVYYFVLNEIDKDYSVALCINKKEKNELVQGIEIVSLEKIYSKFK